MRRTSAALAVMLAALGAPWAGPAQPQSAAADALPEVRAVPADTVVDAFGIGIHLAWLDTPYRDATAVARALSKLGVRHVRDDLYMDNPRQYAGIETVADRGIAFDLIMGRPTSAWTAEQNVHTVATKIEPGAVESIEGTNEWDLSGRSSWAGELLTRQQQLYAAAKAEPRTAGLPLLSPALAFRWNYPSVGDLSPYSDEANGHMYPGGYRPTNEVTRITAALRGAVDEKPLVVTEAGYHNAVNTTNGHLPVPEGVAAVYMPRLLLDHFALGAKRVYSYELIDAFDDPSLSDPEAHFGLLRHDLSPKPAYTAMRSLLALLDDPGPSFETGSMPLELQGMPSDGRSVLTQRRDGSFVLLLWRDVDVYDPVGRKPLSVTPTEVTVHLSRTSRIALHKPTSGPRARDTVEGSSVTVPLGGQVTALVIDEPPADPGSAVSTPGKPRAVAATCAKSRISVTWRSASNGGSPITRYQIGLGDRKVRLRSDARSHTFTGVDRPKAAQVSVRARNAMGWGPTVMVRCP